ncbi:UDP-3-O-(3-hydroxymyristoyl)glucosamine N-acyltransferase [Tamlana fucoidanivorans]|uniref:UDP-3-O-acylglucosamine N-acyltransferase n=1 Tax=Allotamlana fucoidanivorans TaxID=2583814 RepID=A0A5C4SIK6_9FLAO|nr:UDP-3-O-(3-hydroxymyristoyl)glucosamine N-acyltransferase [Tamlana fucoidanivorans]TNJ43532.1 UDP-3-O-(3-hydroxymyristoyl)glucosamine N-acyltransferase [Tamlana fucoidanivorans]
MISYTIEEINAVLNGILVGSTSQKIEGPEELQKAKNHHITFIGSAKYEKYWADSEACAAIVNASITIEPGNNKAFIKVPNADLAMARILELFNPEPPILDFDIHPSAVVHTSATIGSNCKIGPHCYIGKDVVIGDNTILYPNVSIFDESTIGTNSIIWSGTVIRERCVIGNHCIFHTNVSIGADGFGYRPSDDGRGLVKIPQIGNVIIGHHVEIGANTCIDRAKFSSTLIGDGTKIDNLVQIGHNSILGRSCIIAGHSGISGSVTLGDGVIIGGASSVKDHVTIHSGATVGGKSGVISDVKSGQTVLGFPAQEARETLKQWAIIKRLAKK